jgi:hypothetical protein
MLETPTFLSFALNRNFFIALNSATRLTYKNNIQMLRSAEGQESK